MLNIITLKLDAASGLQNYILILKSVSYKLDARYISLCIF